MIEFEESNGLVGCRRSGKGPTVIEFMSYGCTDIAQAVLTALEGNTYVPHDRIIVKAEQGFTVAYLFGVFYKRVSSWFSDGNSRFCLWKTTRMR
jgi:hypothetical protein